MDKTLTARGHLIVRRYGVKPSSDENPSLIHCEYDDPEAVEWRLAPAGAGACQDLSFESKALADKVTWALEDAFGAGRNDQNFRIRRLLDIT